MEKAQTEEGRNTTSGSTGGKDLRLSLELSVRGDKHLARKGEWSQDVSHSPVRSLGFILGPRVPWLQHCEHLGTDD